MRRIIRLLFGMPSEIAGAINGFRAWDQLSREGTVVDGALEVAAPAASGAPA